MSSVNASISHAASLLAPIASSFNLTFDTLGTNPELKNVKENVVRLSITDGVEPAPISPTHGETWDFVSGTARKVFDNAIVGPSGMIGESQSDPFACDLFADRARTNSRDRHKVDVELDREHLPLHSRSTRFDEKSSHSGRTVILFPLVQGGTTLTKVVSDRIHIDAHIEAIKFYYKLAQNSQTWAAS